MFAIKFYLKAHRHSPDKYNLLTEEGDAPGVIRTVIDIAVGIYRENTKASFGFIGVTKKADKTESSTSNTQRFRIYRYIIKNFFGGETWAHYEAESQSAYLMFNKTQGSEEAVDRIFRMFREVYDEFRDIDDFQII